MMFLKLKTKTLNSLVVTASATNVNNYTLRGPQLNIYCTRQLRVAEALSVKSTTSLIESLLSNVNVKLLENDFILEVVALFSSIFVWTAYVLTLS